jgi:alkylation response protein AidB-like acyl-CoA dehydrogenase
MDLSYSSEHDMLRSSIRSFLRDRHSLARRMAASRDPAVDIEDLWPALASELGLLALPLPERVGGMMQDPQLSLLVMEEFGRALVSVPFLDAAIVCGGLLAQIGAPRTDQLLARLAHGEFRPTLAWAEPGGRYHHDAPDVMAHRTAQGRWILHGVKHAVRAVPWARDFLVTARISPSTADPRVSLFLVSAQDARVKVDMYPTIDGETAATLRFESVELSADTLLGTDGAAGPWLDAVFDDAVVALASEGVGVLERMLEMTIEYTKNRRQFGQPLASFQVLQHRMVDMYLRLEMARSSVLLASLKLRAGAAEVREKVACIAKITVGEACRFVGEAAIQLHGGMGVTDEMPISHYFKRAIVIESLLGDSAFHRRRYARATRERAVSVLEEA